MPEITTAMRELLAAGAHGHLVTIDADGSPHVTLTWAGFDGDDLVFATFPDQKKLDNLRRNPRAVVSFEATEHSGPGLHPYLVLEGTVTVSEGGALDVMDRLAGAYIAPGAKFGWRTGPPGFVCRMKINRAYGVGPWGHDF
ncbi:MAG TPA: PPOX class F420-dependent oxidoreductase [Acidimicrobiia bacterium]